MKKNRILLFAGGGLALIVIAIIAVVVIQLLRSDEVDLATEAPQIDAPPASSSSGSGETSTGQSAAAGASSGALHFVIESGSKAQYVVREKLAALPVETNAVGETPDVTGDLYLTEDGLATEKQSTFKVDLRTLKSDESRRDNFIGRNSLQTDQFPFAEYVVTSLDGFPESYVEGTEVALTMNGNLTVKGVTKPIAWEIKARRQGEVLTGIADTDFNMSDFGISPPDVRLAKAQDGVHLQITIQARQAAS